MKLKKRKKSTRYRGSQTHRRGHRKRTKGSGNQGGKGMSGSENQKKSLIINKYGIEYFGSHRALRKGRVAPKPEPINLKDIVARLGSLLRQGKAKEIRGAYEINLESCKILGDGDIKEKLIIKAAAASESAIEKVKKAGGSITLPEVKPEENQEEKIKGKVTSQDIKDSQSLMAPKNQKVLGEPVGVIDKEQKK